MSEASETPDSHWLHEALRGGRALDAAEALMGEAALRELLGSAVWVSLPGGTELFLEGEAGDDAFLVLTGRLGSFANVDGHQRLLGFVQPGELVGEIALLTNEPRSATVLALRDSQLLRIPREALLGEKTPNPHLMAYLSRLLARRLVSSNRQTASRPEVRCVAVVPLGVMQLDPEAPTRLASLFAERANDVAVIGPSDPMHDLGQLDRLEAEHALVVYVADDEDAARTRRCLRQADKLLFVADIGSSLSSEAAAQIDYAASLNRPADIVLINPITMSLPQGSEEWLGHFSPDAIHHVRARDRKDYGRAVRMALRQAVGVVLSGGGARAFAHIGALRALLEAGVPIDLLGGTSMGALVAAAAAVEMDYLSVRERVYDAFVRHNPVNDYVPPLVALARGRKMARLLRKHFGDICIENLWRTFFCCSSNLSEGSLNVHTSGPLWRALRASASIPGLIPPAIERGQVLVDGGVMNNFPSTIMSSLRRGPVIGIEVISGGARLSSAVADIEERSLSWLLNPFRESVPGIAAVLMASATVSSDAQTVAARSAVDVLIQPAPSDMGMLSFDRFDHAVEHGYRTTSEALERAAVEGKVFN